jgi:hypothetical protein
MINWVKRNSWCEVIFYVVVFVLSIWACTAHGKVISRTENNVVYMDKRGQYSYAFYATYNPFCYGEYPVSTIWNPHVIHDDYPRKKRVKDGVERSILVKPNR